ncbi:MAG: DGQHR domain-containing protein [Chloroflexi bacterium]|nr:DGQHR domain-containing protein [Chloroflexota bacterium]
MQDNISALIVNQWLPEWNDAVFDVTYRRKPEAHFYLFRLNAYDLKRLSGVYRRDPNRNPADDINIQRRHDPKRSEEILRYLQDGFPLSKIDKRKLIDQSEARTLRMPGWVPTAIVANILVPGDRRGPKNQRIADRDIVQVEDDNGIAQLTLPKGLEDPNWQPRVHPIEIIDGQHRLWALEEPEQLELPWTEDFRSRLKKLELPVVAFHGLDRTWQAYLFYTINQLPKKIDQSLVFDLYPLLRNEDWLLRFEGPSIYRNTRAQDLTILLWSHPESPWKDRIMRLGGRERGKVTQASFIRSLTATFIKTYKTAGKRVGGLYGSPRGSHNTILEWSREQQAALLIVCWQELRDAIKNAHASWTHNLQMPPENSRLQVNDPAFDGPDTLLATDQGVRGFLSVINDLLVVAYDENEINLDEWSWNREAHHEDDIKAVSDAINSLRLNLNTTIGFISRICTLLAKFDWRLASVIDQNKEKDAYNQAAAYRGSGGYALLRKNLLKQIRDNANSNLKKLADRIMDAEEDEDPE